LKFRLLFVLFLGLHAAKVARLVPFENISDGRPLIEYAHCESFVDIARDRALHAAGGGAWGYDPYVAAGTTTRLGFNPPSTAPVLFDRVARWFLRAETSYKVFVALALFLGPVLLFWATRLFGLSREAAFIAMVTVSAGFLSHDEASRALVQKGQISFWFGCFVGLLNAACLYAGCLRPDRRVIAVLAATSVVLPALDPTLAAFQVVVWALILFTAPTAVRMRAFRWTVVAAVAAVAANQFWLGSFVDVLRAGRTSMEWPGVGARGFSHLLLPISGDWLERLNAAIRVYLVGFGVAQIATFSPEKRRMGRLFWGWALLAAVIAGVGGPAVFRQEPGRFVFAFTTVMLIPASAFMASVMLRPGSVRIVLFSWCLWFGLTWQVVNQFHVSPLRSELTQRETRLLTDLRRLPTAGRVLIQYAPLFTDGLRLAALEGRHAYAGFAASGWTTVPRIHASFVRWNDDWYLFGEPLGSYSEDTLVERLLRFNVTHVVATAPATRKLFASMPSVEEIPSEGRVSYSIFRVKPRNPGGFTLSGRGRVSFDYNRFQVSEAGQGTLVTSFLWAPGFKGPEGVTVIPVQLPGETEPFLAIENAAGLPVFEVRHVR